MSNSTSDPLALFEFYIHLIEFGIVLFFLIALLGFILIYLSSFQGGDITKSRKLRKTLYVYITDNEAGINFALRLANQATNLSFVKIKHDLVIIYVPVKAFWKLYPNGSTRNEIRTRLQSAGFKDYLEFEFLEYSFSAPKNRGKYLEITGEK